MTWERIDDYWGFDEKFPGEPTALSSTASRAVADEGSRPLTWRPMRARARSTTSARPGTASDLESIDDIESLQASNPELQYYERLFRAETVAGFAVTKVKPFERHPRAPGDANGPRPRDHEQRLLQGARGVEAGGHAIGLYSGRVSHPVRAVAGRAAGLLQLRPGGRRAAARRGWLSTRRRRRPLNGPLRLCGRAATLGFFELQAAYWRDIGVSGRDQSHGGTAQPTWRWR